MNLDGTSWLTKPLLFVLLLFLVKNFFEKRANLFGRFFCFVYNIFGVTSCSFQLCFPLFVHSCTGFDSLKNTPPHDLEEGVVLWPCHTHICFDKLTLCIWITRVQDKIVCKVRNQFVVRQTTILQFEHVNFHRMVTEIYGSDCPALISFEVKSKTSNGGRADFYLRQGS